MTTLEEDYKALLKRAHDEDMTLNTFFYDGAHKVRAFYHEEKVWIYSEGIKEGNPAIAATFDPELMMNLLPYLMLAANKGLQDKVKKLTNEFMDVINQYKTETLPACPKCGAIDFDGKCEHGLTPDEEPAKETP
jgi:hypothetical protein